MNNNNCDIKTKKYKISLNISKLTINQYIYLEKRKKKIMVKIDEKKKLIKKEKKKRMIKRKGNCNKI